MTKKAPAPKKAAAKKPPDPRLDILWDRSERERLRAAMTAVAEGSEEYVALMAEWDALGAPK